MRLLVVDDHAISRLGLVIFLGSNVGDAIVEAAANLDEGAAHASAQQDVVLVLVDYSIWQSRCAADPHFHIGALFSGIPVLVTRGAPDPAEAERALAAGAAGYVPRTTMPAELRAMVLRLLSPPPTPEHAEAERPNPGTVTASETHPTASGNAFHADIASSLLLTTREREVMRLLLAGNSNKEIGRNLSILEGTVKAHVHNIMRKMGARNRMQLVLRAQGKTF